MNSGIIGFDIMAEKKAFNFYRNYYDILKSLSKSQQAEFIMALTSVMFFDQHIDDVKFKDSVLNIVWASIKFLLQQSIDGFCSKNKIQYNQAIGTPYEPPSQGGYVPPCQQEEGEEEGKGKEEGKEELSELFVNFYEAYPKHVKKADTLKWFEKNKPDNEMVEMLIDKVNEQIAWRERQSSAGAFVPQWPAPIVWLNGKRWEDELEPAQGTIDYMEGVLNA